MKFFCFCFAHRTRALVTTLGILNSGVNFFIYVIMNRDFRRELQKMVRRFCPCFKASVGDHNTNSFSGPGPSYGTAVSTVKVTNAVKGGGSFHGVKGDGYGVNGVKGAGNVQGVNGDADFPEFKVKAVNEAWVKGVVDNTAEEVKIVASESPVVTSAKRRGAVSVRVCAETPSDVEGHVNEGFEESEDDVQGLEGQGQGLCDHAKFQLANENCHVAGLRDACHLDGDDNDDDDDDGQGQGYSRCNCIEGRNEGHSDNDCGIHEDRDADGSFVQNDLNNPNHGKFDAKDQGHGNYDVNVQGQGCFDGVDEERVTCKSARKVRARSDDHNRFQGFVNAAFDDCVSTADDDVKY
jgi:hypothetical protein